MWKAIERQGGAGLVAPSKYPSVAVVLVIRIASEKANDPGEQARLLGFFTRQGKPIH